MPTVLFIPGWRFFFYANENNESVHIHARKSDMECKFWLDVEEFEIHEAYAYNLGAKDRREVKRLTYQHFDYFVAERNKFKSLKK
ncbi:MAG: DUF4160 domain-containing protein [Cytophagaceae bacterium]|nr:DUF4160 domain-containing protein [Cytophagaceae bacterium]